MEKLPQISKYVIHISHFSIQSNPESAKFVNFWSSPIKIHWIGLDYESSGLIQSIPYPTTYNSEWREHLTEGGGVGAKKGDGQPLNTLLAPTTRSHIRQVSIKFRITARQPIAGRLDTSSPPANRRPAAQDSGAWRHTTAERIVVCLVATRGTDTVRFFGYQKFCDFYIVIIACEVYSLKRNRVW